MKLNAIKDLIGRCIDADIEVPIMMVGGMGLGKSQIIAQLAREKSMGLIDLRLAQMESGDLIGLPYKNGDGSTHWARPEWWPTEGTKGIIFLDELNRAPNDIRQSIFQLILDRKLHTHKLPKGWYVHSAINPDNGEYQVETLDKATNRRFCILEVTPDVDVWLAWAKGQGRINNTLTEFIASNRGLLYKQEEIKLQIEFNPDAYRMLSNMIDANVILKEHQAEIFRGMIGKEASVALIKWLDTNYNKPVSGTEVLTDYASVKTKLKKQRTDENYNTITDLVACLTEKKALDTVQSANLTEFTLDLPKESQTALIAKLPRHIRDLFLKEPRITKLLLDLVSQ